MSLTSRQGTFLLVVMHFAVAAPLLECMDYYPPTHNASGNGRHPACGACHPPVGPAALLALVHILTPPVLRDLTIRAKIAVMGQSAPGKGVVMGYNTPRWGVGSALFAGTLARKLRCTIEGEFAGRIRIEGKDEYYG